MGFIYEVRASDSHYIETVTRGRTEGQGSTIRPAEYHWHLVLVRLQGRMQLVVTGPLSTSGVVPFVEGVELLWIKLKLGTFMPHLPTNSLVDAETILPGAASQSFWLKGSAWQFPDYENVETFIDRLAREEVLARDPLIEAVLKGHPSYEVSPRTVRHRFLRTAGLPYIRIQQIERAQRAAVLLQQGVSILDTVFDLGYFDQAHLTRSLKQLIGFMPAQISRASQPEKSATFATPG